MSSDIADSCFVHKNIVCKISDSSAACFENFTFENLNYYIASYVATIYNNRRFNAYSYMLHDKRGLIHSDKATNHPPCTGAELIYHEMYPDALLTCVSYNYGYGHGHIPLAIVDFKRIDCGFKTGT